MDSHVTITVDGIEYVLAHVGANYHAVRAAHGEHHHLWSGWSSRTVCGREWVTFADPHGHPLEGFGPAVAPTCRSCLGTIGRRLQTTSEDDRIPRLAAAMADSVVTYGSAQCNGVPGDQADRLRSSVKRLLAGRATRLQSIQHEDVVVVATNEHPGHPDVDAAMRAALGAMPIPLPDGTFGSTNPRPEPGPWMFEWADWQSLV